MTFIITYVAVPAALIVTLSVIRYFDRHTHHGGDHQ